MMKNLHLLPTITCMLMAYALSSCRNEICYNHYPTLDVSFIWEQEWERDYGNHHLNGWDPDYFGKQYDELRPWVPEWINMIEYLDNGQTHENYLSPDGSRFHVNGSNGNSILLYNGDTEYIILSDLSSPETARATASSRSRASLGMVMERHPDARTTNSPDMLYSAYFEQGPTIKNHEIKQMPVMMKPLVYTYLIVYEFEQGREHISKARGALGGMAESVYLKTGSTSESSSIILFDCNIIPHGCQAEVRSFGVPGFPDIYYGRTAATTPQRLYTLNLEVMLTNGKTLTFDFDVSDQLKLQPRGGVIKVTGIRIEDGQNQEASGFVVDVDDWNEHSEQIDLAVGGQRF